VRIEGAAQIEGVRNRIEHCCSRYIAQSGMQGGGELDVRRTDLARELQPLLDRQVRIRVAPLARRQFLKCGCQYAELHWPRREVADGHGSVLL
jgi:hypothetical protein